MCVPELPVQAGQLGELRGEVRSRMERRHGKVAPDEAEAIEAVQERLHRSTGLEAVRASEIPILDERQLRAARAGDVITSGGTALDAQLLNWTALLPGPPHDEQPGSPARSSRAGSSASVGRSR